MMRKENELYLWCTKCGAILNNQNGFDPDEPFWKCQKCGANLYDPEGIYQGERFEGVFWHCDKCDALLNIQEGFSDLYDYWKCKICSHVNRIAESEIEDFTKQFEVNNEELIKRNYEHKQNVETKKEEKGFCAYCGNRINVGAKFCSSCGKATNNNFCYEQEKTENFSEEKNVSFGDNTEQGDTFPNEQIRKETYDGEIRKCPNCGEVLKSFTLNCPTCGYELRNSNTTNYIHEFTRKLEMATTTEQKDDLIRHFVMPNTKEDIYEFMILAAANLEANSDNSDAWHIKIEQAYQKSRIIFGDSPEFKIIEDIYIKAADNYNKINKKKKIASIGVFFKQHTKGIVLSILGIIAIIMLAIMVVGLSKGNDALLFLFTPIIALGAGIAIAAADWKKK